MTKAQFKYLIYDKCNHYVTAYAVAKVLRLSPSHVRRVLHGERVSSKMFDRLGELGYKVKANNKRK